MTDICLALLQIKNSESKKHLKLLSDLICDSNFYVKLENNLSVLKQKHLNDYPEMKLTCRGSRSVATSSAEENLSSV